MTLDATEALITLGEALDRATTVGRPAPLVERLAAWIRAEPRPGDLILEMSTSFRGPAAARLGVYLKSEERAVCYHEREDVNLARCEECDGEERGRERFVWLEVLAPPCGSREHCGDRACPHRHRWHNARFIRLPATPAQLQEATAIPGDPGGGSFDRARVVGMLANAGIEIREPDEG